MGACFATTDSHWLTSTPTAGITPITSRRKPIRRVDCCKIAISLIVPQKGEETAQACAIAWFRSSAKPKASLPMGKDLEPGLKIILFQPLRAAAAKYTRWIG
jgi:hypothetical protein